MKLLNEHPIALAVNYSPQARELYRSGQADFDYFKCPNWPDVLRDAQQVRPVYVHHEIMAGQDQPRDGDIRNLHESVESTGTPYINTHVAPLVADIAGYSDLEQFQQAHLRVAADIERLCAAFGPSRVIVENVPWERRRDYPIACVAAAPAFVTGLLERTGAMLLLDLAHAAVAARESDEQIRPFVEAHPLHRLRELHVTGFEDDPGGQIRDSMPMRSADWQLFAWALDRIADGAWPRPWVITLEYGGVGPHFEWRTNTAILAEQLRQCAGLLRERGLRE